MHGCFHTALPVTGAKCTLDDRQERVVQQLGRGAFSSGWYSPQLSLYALRKTFIAYFNAYIWNLEKWYR